MKRLSLLAGFCFAFVLNNAAAAPATDTNALVKTWETQVIGPAADRATCFLTFSNDFTWTGYGIALKSSGSVTFDGTWSVDAKQRITGGFTEFRNDGDVGGTFIALLNGSNKLRARAITATHRPLKLDGVAQSTPRDVSGTNWVGEVRTRGNKVFQSYTFTASTNLPGWFDVTGTGVGEGGTYTISGGLVVTSDRRANGYLISDFGSAGTTSTWSFAGKFLPSLDRAVFRGSQDNGHNLVINAAKQ
jgi:hypothetical protein